MDALDLMRCEGIYDVSGEQVQCWLNHNNVGELQEPQVLSLEFNLEDPDIYLVEKSIEIMFRRHESLRTFFRMIDGDLKQCVLPYSEEVFCPAYYDLEAGINIGENTIPGIKKAAISSLSDLAIPPLLKCCLIKYSKKDYFIFVVVHHIISDQWSRVLIYNELTHLYKSLKNGMEVDVRPNTIQLRDYVNWQKNWSAENGNVARRYWNNKIGIPGHGFLAERLFNQNAFPGKFPATGNGIALKRSEEEQLLLLENSDMGDFLYHINGSEYVRLQRFAVYCGSNLLTVMTSSLQLLFFLLAEKRPVLIGSPFANRVHGTETIIGYLIGIIYLHMEIREQMTIKSLVKEGYIDFLKSCMYPIYNHAEMQTSINLRPYTDLYVNFLGKEFSGNANLDENALQGQHVRKGRDFFGMKFEICEFADGLSCRWLYNTGLYSLAMINHILKQHRRVLRLMVENAEISIGKLHEYLISDSNNENPDGYK